MKKYCFDTSGVSNPLEMMPEDIHRTMWEGFCGLIQNGHVAVTTEIYEEMCRIPGNVGECLAACKTELVLEVGEDHWDWQTYVMHIQQMQDRHQDLISEFTGGSSKTICLNDLTIIALARTLRLPVVSIQQNSYLDEIGSRKRRIPNICKAEGVVPLNFNDFLRKENSSF